MDFKLFYTPIKHKFIGPHLFNVAHAKVMLKDAVLEGSFGKYFSMESGDLIWDYMGKMGLLNKHIKEAAKHIGVELKQLARALIDPKESTDLLDLYLLINSFHFSEEYRSMRAMLNKIIFDIMVNCASTLQISQPLMFVEFIRKRFRRYYGKYLPAIHSSSIVIGERCTISPLGNLSKIQLPHFYFSHNALVCGLNLISGFFFLDRKYMVTTRMINICATTDRLYNDKRLDGRMSFDQYLVSGTATSVGVAEKYLVHYHNDDDVALELTEAQELGKFLGSFSCSMRTRKAIRSDNELMAYHEHYVIHKKESGELVATFFQEENDEHSRIERVATMCEMKIDNEDDPSFSHYCGQEVEHLYRMLKLKGVPEGNVSDYSATAPSIELLCDTNGWERVLFLMGKIGWKDYYFGENLILIQLGIHKSIRVAPEVPLFFILDIPGSPKKIDILSGIMQWIWAFCEITEWRHLLNAEAYIEISMDDNTRWEYGLCSDYEVDFFTSGGTFEIIKGNIIPLSTTFYKTEPTINEVPAAINHIWKKYFFPDRVVRLLYNHHECRVSYIIDDEQYIEGGLNFLGSLPYFGECLDDPGIWPSEMPFWVAWKEEVAEWKCEMLPRGFNLGKAHFELAKRLDDDNPGSFSMTNISLKYDHDCAWYLIALFMMRKIGLRDCIDLFKKCINNNNTRAAFHHVLPPEYAWPQSVFIKVPRVGCNCAYCTTPGRKRFHLSSYDIEDYKARIVMKET